MTRDPVQEKKRKSSFRVRRGGSWNLSADYLVVSARNFSGSPGDRRRTLGLRLVRSSKVKTKDDINILLC